VLIDDKHVVTQLYNLVNVPTAVWINEKGTIVRPPEVAYADNRFKFMHGVDSGEYLDAIRDWARNGEKSVYLVDKDKLRSRLKAQTPQRALADAEFALGEYLFKAGKGPDAIPHFKEAQRLAPDNWNYKRQAWALADAQKDYGTTFAKEVGKLNGKPYYEPRTLPKKP
jgi:tetratricopeptide (TPR) repeat protein